MKKSYFVDFTDRVKKFNAIKLEMIAERANIDYQRLRDMRNGRVSVTEEDILKLRETFPNDDPRLVETNTASKEEVDVLRHEITVLKGQIELILKMLRPTS